MFLESILFLQKSQNFQKQCCPILATWLRVSLVACLQSWAYLENFRDSLANQSPSRKKYLENFSKSGFLGFSRLILATCSWMEALVARVTQKFSRLPLRLPHEWNFQSWKTLRQNFQNFVLGVSRLVLATCLWLGLITKIVCFAQWGPFLGLASKNFHFSLASLDYSSSYLPFPLSKPSCSHTKSPYSPSPLHQSSRKGMGFVSFSIYFTFLAIYFLDCVFLLISVYLMREYGYLIFWWNCCVIFGGFAVIHFALSV